MEELYCHGCNRYVQFRFNCKSDGCHTIICPNCGHKHYRVISNGKITSARWKSSGPAYSTTTGTSYLSIDDTSSSSTSGYWAHGRGATAV